jgi:hypothetical protein
MQTIFKKWPFKENGKLSKLFRLVLWGLNFPAGYQTPQNQVLRDIRPCRKMAELCIFYSIHLFCGVWYPAEQCLAGSDTTLNKVLRVSDPAEQSPTGYQTPQNNIQKQIFLQFRKRIQQYFRVWIRGLYGVDLWKKPEVKISCYCTFKSLWKISWDSSRYQKPHWYASGHMPWSIWTGLDDTPRKQKDHKFLLIQESGCWSLGG